MVANTKKFVLDASFLLSVLLPDEKGLDSARSARDILTHKENRFFAPKLLEFEVFNSVRSAILSKRVKKGLAKDVISAFEKIQIDYLDIDYKDVLELSLKKNLSFYDASYLHLAKVRKCGLLTLDTSLSKMLQ